MRYNRLMKKKREMRIKTPEQEARAMAEREANRRAEERGEPLPFPNIWDTLDPTKLPRDATPEQIHQRYIEFMKICPKPKRKAYTI